MKKIAFILLALAFIGCDTRPPGVYEAESGMAYDALSTEHRGITYLYMDAVDKDRKGWVVDYSQFFTKDTLIVNGSVWVRTNKTEKDLIKEQKIPQLENE
ncbi:MAG: hypothetical protein P8J32_02840 [bacterium]|nr:hypothetical protein [bacterium]